MALPNSHLAHFKPLDIAVSACRNPTLSELLDSLELCTAVYRSIYHFKRHLNLVSKEVAQEFLEELERETPSTVFEQWMRVRRSGRESEVYPPELQRTLMGLLERWTNKEAIEKEFGFLMDNGKWIVRFGFGNKPHVESVVEGMKVWVEKRRRLG
jgi:hypothetical protein